MSAIREVMKELEQYKLLAEEGARAKAKCERLADEMRDFENCRRDLALAHETVRDLRGQVAVAEERAAAAVEARNEALEQKNATDKELNLKTFALKRSQKASCWLSPLHPAYAAFSIGKGHARHGVAWRAAFDVVAMQ